MAPTVFDVLDKKLAELQQSQEEFLAGEELLTSPNIRNRVG